jgi:hypothetical protein
MCWLWSAATGKTMPDTASANINILNIWFPFRWAPIAPIMGQDAHGVPCQAISSSGVVTVGAIESNDIA